MRHWSKKLMFIDIIKPGTTDRFNIVVKESRCKNIKKLLEVIRPGD